MAVPVIMPRQGQSVESCIISKWNKKKGDRVNTGDILFSYETDKASFEEEARMDGTLLDIFFDEGEDVVVGLPFVAYFIHVLADEEEAETAFLALFEGRGEVDGLLLLQGIEGRPGIAERDLRVALGYDANLDLDRFGFLLVGMLNDVDDGLFAGKFDLEKGFIIKPGKLPSNPRKHQMELF